MNRQQLEIQFDTPAQWTVAIRNLQRRRRAQWWFARMRAVVEEALEWRAAPAARPQQVYLSL
jgi:hypothetical protein